MAVVSTGFIVFDLCLIIGAAFLAALVYFKHSYRYWKVKRVPYLEPTFPLGNDEYFFTKSATFAGEAKSWYDQLKARGHKFGGAWSFYRKVLVLVDPDYIRDVLTRDFHHFANRDMFANEKFDLQGCHLFNVRNSHWKPLRQKLTPTFTSGKMKMMFESVMQCCDHLVEHLEECAETGENIDSRKTLSSFTIDVIGSVAFGVDCNSFSKEESDFRKYANLFFRPNFLDYIRLLCLKLFPDLARKLRLKIGNTRRTKFFRDMVKQTIDHRIQFKVTRPDFLQLLINMNVERDGKEVLSFDQIVANTILFFVAGFDTPSTAMNFALFELARNPDLQEKARQEVRKVMGRNDGQTTYEGLREMTYVKQVLDESMRMYPPLLTLSRVCTKDYELRNTDIVIEKGTSVVISTLGLGRDPEYFPDPERFDPDRFSAEEKAKRHPYVHIPFGEGPRNCIGLRFGVMQSKIGLARILSNFRLSVSLKTKLRINLDKKLFLLKENEPIYLKAEKL
uniref:Cytochrome P450 CYP6DG1v1 n=1 Tax=Dendroctonus rhizophagus TaxID=77169 RepID=G3CLK4_9CUCU|nr:cytochrome P450 CYP6DG1v1 [Dendroctonus rhizophagus]